MTTTDFGFEQVRPEEKGRLVNRVFSSVASRYDIMNDLMSAGVHRLWKRIAVEMTAAKPGQHVLDVAGGTGDITARLLQRVGSKGRAVLTDINGPMLQVGCDRLVDQGMVDNVVCVQANAECLPFADNSFDVVTIAFGLRNVTDKCRALRSMFRVLRPGGRLVVLEFSHVVLPVLARLYDVYSFALVPRIGEWVTGDRASYQYLVESIRRHPNQETLQAMMEDAGFEMTDVHNLSAGIVAIHRGFKL